jgi:hypothetical protein
LLEDTKAISIPENIALSAKNSMLRNRVIERVDFYLLPFYP